MKIGTVIPEMDVVHVKKNRHAGLIRQLEPLNDTGFQDHDGPVEGTKKTRSATHISFRACGFGPKCLFDFLHQRREPITRGTANPLQSHELEYKVMGLVQGAFLLSP